MNRIELKQIDELLSPDNASLDLADSGPGDVWRSAHELAQTVAYSARMPAGIHIGAGIARAETGAPSLGRFDLHGACFIILQCPPGFAEPFSSRVGKGRCLFSGLHIAPDRAPDPVLANLPPDTPFMRVGKIPHRIAGHLCSPIDGWYRGRARRLAMEARASEFLAVAAGLLSGGKTAARLPARPYVARARDIIDADLMNVPGLAELARRAAINPRSLTQGFRASYGCSIYEYVSERRMREAIRLLEEGLSVSETARRVGYSLGYFSQKFYARHGFRPGSLKGGHKAPDKRN